MTSREEESEVSTTTTSVTTAEVREVSDIIGHWGRWQSNIAAFGISVAAFSAFNGLSSAFYSPNINFDCESTVVSTPGNDNLIPSRQYLVSIERHPGDEWSNQCSVNGSSCTSFVYDTSIFHKTAVSEWDLVCDRSWLSSLSQSVYMLGIVFSALIFGHCSDKYGRKPSLLVAVIIEILSGFLSAFSPSVNIFIFSRFLLAFGCYGRNLTGFLLAIESVGTKYRAAMGIAVQLGWATGYCLLPLMAYLINDFRHLLLSTTIPEIAWLIWLYWIPESPRWLLTHDRNEEAKVIILAAVKMNGLTKGDDKDLVKDVDEKFLALKENLDREREAVTSNSRNQTFWDLWRSPLLILYSLIFYFTWFTNAFVYYGISLNVGDLAGDLYWNFFWAGLVEFPSYFFCMVAFKYVGRRPLLAAKMFGAGIGCLAIVPFYFSGSTTGSSSTWILAFALFGKFCITSSFGIIYVYSAEVYPTVLRQIGVGSCSVAGRGGSIIAPFVKELSQYTNFGVSMLIFGILSVLTGVACIKLPETKDKDIPDTIEDVEKLRLKK